MSEDEINKLSLEGAKSKLRKIFKNPIITVYLSNQKQIEDIANQIDSLKVNISDSDTTVFDNYMKWIDKLPKLREGQDGMRKSIDPSELERERKRRLAPDRNSPEYYAQKRKNKLTESD